MKDMNIAVYHGDPAIAKNIAVTLRNHFRAIHVVTSIDDLKMAIAKHKAGLTVLDIESDELQTVRSLHQEFPHVAIVCTHRLADENMWMAVLDAGADDICQPGDVAGLLAFARRSDRLARTAAA